MTTQPVAPTSAPIIPPLPRGVKTSEFWVSAITTVISLLTGLGVLHPDFAQRYQEQIAHVAWFAALAVPAMYTLGRNIAKHGHQVAVAKVVQAAIAVGGDVSMARKLVGNAETEVKKDSGFALIALIGAILLIVGVIWLLVGFSHHRFDAWAAIVAGIGLVLVWFDGGGTVWRRRP